MRPQFIAQEGGDRSFFRKVNLGLGMDSVPPARLGLDLENVGGPVISLVVGWLRLFGRMNFRKNDR